MKLKYFTIPTLIIVLCAVALSKILEKKNWNRLNFKPGDAYKQDWKKIDSLVQLGQSETVLSVIEHIYQKAKEEKNHVQIVKAIIYKINNSIYKENADEENIRFIENELKNITFPARPLVQSILAEQYWNYYQNHRYAILQRTVTTGFKNDDIQTWDAEKFVQKTIGLYQASLENADSLKRVELTLIDSILITYPGSKKLRPTLYDFLMHRAIDFFANEEAGLVRPADFFVIKDAGVFSDAGNFIGMRVAVTDSLSPDYHLLVLLRQLTAFRIEENDVNALVDLELKRLKLMRQKSVVSDKDSLYLQALIKLESDFKNDTITARTGYEIAQYYFSKVNKPAGIMLEKAGEASYEQYDVRAFSKCNEVIKRYPGTLGAHNCEALKQEIIQPDFSLQAELVNVPEKPSLAIVQYKNITKLYFKIIRSDSQLDKLNDRYEKENVIEELNKRKAESKWEIVLPEVDDYRYHTTEIKINALPAGKYYLIAAANKDFNADSTKVAYARFWISSLSLITKSNPDGNLEIYVLDRTTGHPVGNCDIKTYFQRYNYTSRAYDLIFSGTYKTNSDGYATVPAHKEHHPLKIELIYKNDKLDITEYFHAGNYRESELPQTQAWVFTDRAIYRPGQTVFFKCILIESYKKQHKIKPAQSVMVRMYDVNYQLMKEQQFITNEYGTFNGNFVLPAVGLNGNYTIQVENFGIKNFRVEEYKRPRFQVQFEPLKGSYRLNDIVEVKGNARMYSGSQVDNAQVKYRVVRNARYPIWWGNWRRHHLPVSPEQEIASGITRTDATGNFTVSFTAIPDFSIDKSVLPVFTYTIYADVTDLSGETQSGQASVSVGYVALEADMDFKETLFNIEAARIKITTQNLNGEFEAAQGTITIHQLIAPDKLLRKKLWQHPDRFMMSEDEYEKNFPSDEYRNKNEFSRWEKGRQVLHRAFNTDTEKELVLRELVTWEQGAYLATLKTTDRFGNEVKAEKYFTVLNPSNRQMPYPKYDYFYAEKATAEPGEKARLIIGSSAKEVKVLFELMQDTRLLSRQWIALNNEKKTIEIPVEEKHRGNIAATFIFIKDNRSYAFTQVITVPYTNKELNVEWETFRDKLSPGQAEQWRLKISGSKGEKVAAELLAGMYDASLDAFVQHNWELPIWRGISFVTTWSSGQNFRAIYFIPFQKHFFRPDYRWQQYDELNWFDLYGYYRPSYSGRYNMRSSGATYMYKAAPMMSLQTPFTDGQTAEESEKTSDVAGTESQKSVSDRLSQPQKQYQSDVENAYYRTNLQETAFYFPSLYTDETGKVIINFTIPEALTRWKFMGLAHTKELQTAIFSREVVTQKELMVFPNMPRFLREGDKIILTAKISNLSENDIEGMARLRLFDAFTLKPLDDESGNLKPEISFDAKKGQSISLSWSITVPQGIEAVNWRITATAGHFTDGEEDILPVMKNKILVTETLPVWIKSGQTKTFRLEKLIQSSNLSNTLQHHKLTFEFTANPAWYAIQSLPYLMEYPYECAEQIFNSLYANTLAAHIVNSMPKVKAVFQRWKDTDALLSNLYKNQELKNILLEETPWVIEAQNETERKKRIALLFDLNTMSYRTETDILKLEKMQLPNGGFPWFGGMPDNEYITLYILTGLGRLDKLNVIQLEQNNRYKQIVLKAVRYCDDRMKERYENLKANKVKTDDMHIDYMQIQYLYARSYINKYIEVPSSHYEAYQYYMRQAEKYWSRQNHYMKGMIALSLHRAGNTQIPSLIMRSLEETAVRNEEIGMYWKDITGGYYWYQAPVETQALMIEAFDEISKNENLVDELRIWLLKHKQTNSWGNSKSTADACYSLLLRGTSWVHTYVLPDIKIGSVKITDNGDILQHDIRADAGSGYFKTTWNQSSVKPDMGVITLAKKDKGMAWGALYWQYFEQLDKVTAASTPLQLKKQLFLQENTKSGPRIIPLSASTKLKPGDLVNVRIELRVDRDMEFVHMKDMRASGFEPVNVLSQYKWQGGLGYYESTRDVATHFFFDYLPKGTYVFEYHLRVAHKGDFSNGITTIQCMYAPEFASRSEGVRVKVD